MSQADLNEFHTDDYLHFLSHLTPDNMQDVTSQLERFNLGADCPVFDGMWEYCQAYTGGSIGGAARLNQGCSDIVINWFGWVVVVGLGGGDIVIDWSGRMHHLS